MKGGGINEWLWKGDQEMPTAQIEAVVNCPELQIPLRYRVDFTIVGQRLELIDEAIEEEYPKNSKEKDVFFYYRYRQGHPVLNIKTGYIKGPPRQRQLRREDLKPDQSVLSQRKDPDLYPELTYLSNTFSQIRLYRDWNVGRYTSARLPQKLDLPEDFLLEDWSNLAHIPQVVEEEH